MQTTAIIKDFFQLVESTDERVSPLLTAPAITLVRCRNTNKTTIKKGCYCEIHYLFSTRLLSVYVGPGGS